MAHSSAIHTGTLVSPIDNGSGELLQAPDIELVHGKFPSDRHLRVIGHDNILAVGDAALISVGDVVEQIALPTADILQAQTMKLNCKNLLLSPDYLFYRGFQLLCSVYLETLCTPP